ncbi:ATP-binding cassette domain-containing protein [Paenibacillus sp. MBLB4367]|uniref:ATP-binding cassette domain-containing protein n=1 Tax=Paenibacillus sp. MBLB4367 TaxID=3384767 RepID=UPI003907F771
MTIVVDGVTASVAVMNGAKSVLHDVSCRFETGQITLLVGRTGSGKSSLLQTVAGLLAPESGTVTYGGEQAPSRIGIVFQYPEHQLFARTVQGEFEYTLRPFRLPKAEAERRMKEALERVGLPQSFLGRSPFSLSGGEKRKLALACAFAAEPDWLLLDEPSASLDADGVEWLADVVSGWCGRASGGVIIATHDLDTFFPLADKAVLLKDGRVVAETAISALVMSPKPLMEAGIGLPAFMRAMQKLEVRGVAIPAMTGVTLPMTPSALAEAILQAPGKAADAALRTALAVARPEASDACAAVSTCGDKAGMPLEAVASAIDAVPARHAANDTRSAGQMSGIPSDFTDAAVPPVHDRTAGTHEAEPERRRIQSLARQLDPRAKWAVSMLVSVGILLQDRWIGIGISAVCTAVLFLLSGSAFRPVWRWTKPFLYFTLFSIAFSGLQLSLGTESSGFSLGFSGETAMLTLKQFVKILLVMVTGLLFTLSTTQMQMKQALEVTFGALEKWKLPVGAFALGASLLLRFIPIISQEVERLKLAVKARSASFAKGKPLRVRDAPAFVIPLVLSVLQTAEDLSVAMEARGYKISAQKRTMAIRLRMKRRDAAAIAAGTAILMLQLAVK